jgi:geranylgeranyl pyrophosphate synthase
MKLSTAQDLQETRDAVWCRSVLRQVEEHRRHVLGEARAFSRAAAYQAESTGKRLRPLLLVCFSCLGQPSPRTKPTAVRAAAAVELLHEASLIHDDVLDQSLVRRGRPSVPESFGVRTAAYLGAYMASTSVAILAEVCEAEAVGLDLELLCVLSQAQLEEGLGPPRDSAAQRQRTLRVIQGKTGSLFKLCAQVGAALAPPSDGRDALRTMAAPFSEHLALAFQLRDDLADLENDAHIRRPGGNDLLRGLPTLPFQLWAASRPHPERAWDRLLRCRNDRAAAEDLQQEILAAGVQGQVRATIRTELGAARSLLNPFPGGAARETLDSLIDQLG